MAFEKGQPNPGFKKGQSGNPGGRPKMAIDVQALARAHTKLALDTLVDCMKSQDGAIRISAARVLLDRAWGKPIQAIEADVRTRPQSPGVATLSVRERAALLMAAKKAHINSRFQASV